MNQRRDQINKVVDLKGLAEVMGGVRWNGNVCKCPFHGSDSRPSMYYYPDSNSIYCFGCPPKKGRYDATWFVCTAQGWSLHRAMKYLEDQNGIKHTYDEQDEQDDEWTWDEVNSFFTTALCNRELSTKDRLALRQGYWEAQSKGDVQWLLRQMTEKDYNQMINKLGL